MYARWVLTALLVWPAVAAVAILIAPPRWAKHLGFVASLIESAIAVPLWWTFVPSGGMQFVCDAPWIQVPLFGTGAPWSIHYTVGVDGISLFMVLLTTLLVPLSVLGSYSYITTRERAYYALLLVLTSGMIGVFVALDLFLFYVMWEVMLIPMYFIIGVWGGEGRLYAAIKFFIYTMLGSLLMLVAILALVLVVGRRTGIYTFSYEQLMAGLGNLGPLAYWLFAAFFLAFAIKVPVFPFHTWLPDAHTEAPTAGSVILAGVLLKMGTYGFIRFSLPLLPADPLLRHKIIQIVIVLSLIGIIYGALVCLMQKDMKRLIAYSSVSHLGFCTLGIFALTPNGLSGSVLQQINHGISTGALFLIVGVLYERRHTRLISEFGGLATPMPNFAAIYLIVSLSSLGMPLLNGFIGEFTILQGAFQVSKAWAAWGSLGVVLGAAYLLWLYQRVMFGPVTQFANEDLPDLNLREYATLVPLVILAFWIGIYPKPFFTLIEKPVQKIVEQVNPGFYQAEHAKLPPPELPAAMAETK